jgi:nucleoside-diphosphate-sugar epimerase
MMRIGVTGAFGFLGANFVAALLEDRGRLGFEKGGIEIMAFASRTRSNPLFDASKVVIQGLDVLDREDLVRKFSGLDAVAHFAGRVDYRPAAMRAVWDTDVLGSKRVFDAALEAGVPRLLYASSVCALGDGARDGSAARLADESSAPYGDARWPISFASPSEALAAVEDSDAGDYGFLGTARVAYLDAKLAGWELAKFYAREKGLPVVTIFPGTAVGSGDLHHAISKLIDTVWEGRLRLSFEGASSFVGVRDLAKGALLALARGRPGEGYVVAGGEEDNLSYAEFQSLVAALARSEGSFAQNRPLVPPRGLLLGLAAIAERAMPEGRLTRAFVLSGSLRNVCSAAKARAELGYEPSVKLATAILECRRFGEIQRAATGPARGQSLAPVLRSP